MDGGQKGSTRMCGRNVNWQDRMGKSGERSLLGQFSGRECLAIMQ